MMRHYAQNKQQAGDTIVEVLIAITVISVVLVGAFAVSNRSTQAIQDSAEHDKAQQYLQAEVESLRSYLNTVSAVPTDDFCFKANVSGAAVFIDDTPATNACNITDGGASYAQSISPVDGSANTYDCIIKWDAVGGGTSQVEFYYRDYPTGPTTP